EVHSFLGQPFLFQGHGRGRHRGAPYRCGYHLAHVPDRPGADQWGRCGDKALHRHAQGDPRGYRLYARILQYGQSQGIYPFLVRLGQYPDGGTVVEDLSGKTTPALTDVQWEAPQQTMGESPSQCDNVNERKFSFSSWGRYRRQPYRLGRGGPAP